MPPQQQHLPVGFAYVILLLVPAVAAALLFATLEVVKDEETAVAVAVASVVAFVVLLAAAVTLTTVARDLRRRNPGGGEGLAAPAAHHQPANEGSSASAGAGQVRAEDQRTRLSLTDGVVVLLTFVVLTAVPAAVVVGAVTLLRENGNLSPEYALPVILLVGLSGLLALLAMMVAVFDRFNLVRKEHALGLPQGSIQAVIALGLILIFAIIGVYLHGTMEDGDNRNELGLQLLTTVSTLVVAVAGFYFGARATNEATSRGVEAARGTDEGGAANGPATPGGGGPHAGAGPQAPQAPDVPDEVDEATKYGTASPVTGLSAADVMTELEDPAAKPADSDMAADLEMEEAATDAGELPDVDELAPEILPDEPEPADMADRREGG